jgi:hypothetical protein
MECKQTLIGDFGASGKQYTYLSAERYQVREYGGELHIPALYLSQILAKLGSFENPQLHSLQ